MMEQVKSAVQIICPALDSFCGGRVPCGVAATHVIADFLDFKMVYQILNEFRGTVAPVFIVAALAAFRIGYDAQELLTLPVRHSKTSFCLVTFYFSE